MYSNLASPEEGKVYYLSQESLMRAIRNLKALMFYDIEEREEQEIMKANTFEIAAQGKKMLFKEGDSWGITEVGKSA